LDGNDGKKTPTFFHKLKVFYLIFGAWCHDVLVIHISFWKKWILDQGLKAGSELWVFMFKTWIYVYRV
jgi:hypothetical protein